MIDVRIITPGGMYLHTEVDQLNARSVDGNFGLLPDHMPMVAMLDISSMTLIHNGVSKDYAVSGGLLEYSKNIVTILTDAIEGEEDIDIERAKAAKERAEKRLQAKEHSLNMRRAEVALRKAINRINVKGQ
ncbi:F0F1 ATP synthase subunit epsilon [Erysipelotrichaceae bacterium MTC7]|nr:F0F1 ATP synthase subunit epsilon [Erysipelotrichaceae bacterium MTC7]